MTSKIFEITVVLEGGMCVIPVPFDPKATFGKVRAPVRVTINGHTFRSTIFRMGDRTFVPFRKSNREPALIQGGERVKVRIDSDTAKRVVTPPADLARALKKQPRVWQQWRKLSYTNQRECAEAVAGAKRPETRSRRIDKVVSFVVDKAGSK
jgi:Bacteriocin-protection, YdeI or OmpD-Associated/Domain of unknown function (DUF1905)